LSRGGVFACRHPPEFSGRRPREVLWWTASTIRERSREGL
jgi:hypothetical protein